MRESLSQGETSGNGAKMSIPYNTVTAVIELANIVHNYHVLNDMAGNVIPVVKADAYGHGLMETAQALADAGAEIFAVGTVAEAGALRASGHARQIISLLGPAQDSDYDLLWKTDVIPFIHNFAQLDRLEAVQAEKGKRLPIALKFDSGMRRLGFTQRDVPLLAMRLGAMKNVRLFMIASHLATADEPGSHAYVTEQEAAFAAIRKAFAQEGLTPKACLANSAAILAYPSLYWDYQRGGIALYGCNPFYGTALEDRGLELKPAMSVKTTALSVHPLKAGQSISYGRTYTAQKDMTVAIAAVGYADAYSRGLSGKAHMCLRGKRARVLGRVCMQMTAVDVTDIPDAAPGDDIWLLGGEGAARITPEELAAWWETITYEVFCLLGLNKREYI